MPKPRDCPCHSGRRYTACCGRIVHAAGDEVLFDARIFERGQDRSFAELSTFVREDGAWRYASGKALPRAGLPPAFRYEDFVRAADGIAPI
jgi:uncharacterized protein YchJ